jgi:cobalt-zinc-cadmium efflux system protein
VISVAVVIGAGVIALTGLEWIDPALSLAIAAVIVVGTWGLLRDSVNLALDGAPRGIDVAEVRAWLTALPGVEEIHDLHCWTLTSGLHSASVHIRASAGATRSEVLAEVQRVLRDAAGVDHATIQVEQGEEVVCHVTPGHA